MHMLTLSIAHIDARPACYICPKMSDSRSQRNSSVRRPKAGKENVSDSSSSMNLSIKDGLAPPDVVYKLSKKIAQLTKVIYYLNTKNEDHTVEVQSLAEAYEDEIQQVCVIGFTTKRFVCEGS